MWTYVNGRKHVSRWKAVYVIFWYNFPLIFSTLTPKIPHFLENDKFHEFSLVVKIILTHKWVLKPPQHWTVFPDFPVLVEILTIAFLPFVMWSWILTFSVKSPKWCESLPLLCCQCLYCKQDPRNVTCSQVVLTVWRDPKQWYLFTGCAQCE